MQPPVPGAPRPPIGIALDGDFAYRIDAVLAVAMLNGLTAKTEARRISLSVSRPSLPAAQVADVISSFYSGRPAGSSQGAGLVREGMIGMPEGTAPVDDPAPLAATLSRKAADGTVVYASTIKGLIDTPENSILIRNLILAQHDKNAAIVLAGPATGLVRILGLYRSGPQIESKVRYLVAALGSFSGGPADPSVRSDVAAARKLFAEWPTPVVAAGLELGEAMRFPGSSIEAGFAWAPNHPVADAYRLFQSMPYDAPAPALAAVLYAAHPEGGYFKLSEPGTISVLADGRTQFTPGTNGRHRYLIADPAQKERVTKLYADMVSAPPAPRPIRGRPPVVAPPPPSPAATPIKP